MKTLLFLITTLVTHIAYSATPLPTPSIHIVSPATGSLINPPVTVQVSVDPTVPILGVGYYIGGVSASALVKTPPYSITLTASQLGTSPAFVQVVSYGVNGVRGTDAATYKIAAPIPSPTPSVVDLTAYPVYIPPSVSPWTAVSPLPSTHVVYVSSSTGKDSNPGTQALPIQTISKAQALDNAGLADWILLKKGDTFVGGLFKHGSGASSLTPSLVSNYGQGARPIMTSGISVGPYRGVLTGTTHVAIIGIDFEAGASGLDSILSVAGVNDLLVEDCKIVNFYDGIDIEIANTNLRNNNVRIRRNEIMDNTSVTGTGHSQGIYIAVTDNLLIEENVFDFNGYDLPGHLSANIFNHSAYLHTNRNVTARGNIIARGQDSFQMRNGGFAEDNFFYSNGIHHFMGRPAGWVKRNVYDISNDIIPVGNYILPGASPIPGPSSTWLPRGFGLWFNPPQSVTDNVTIDQNLFIHQKSIRPYGFALAMDNSGTGKYTITNNTVFDYAPSGIGATATSLVTLSNNIDPNQKLPKAGFIPVPTYVDSTVSVEKYIATLGLGSTEWDFLKALRNQSKDTWNPKLQATSINAYFNAGFKAK